MLTFGEPGLMPTEPWGERLGAPNTLNSKRFVWRRTVWLYFQLPPQFYDWKVALFWYWIILNHWIGVFHFDLRWYSFHIISSYLISFLHNRNFPGAALLNPTQACGASTFTLDLRTFPGLYWAARHTMIAFVYVCLSWCLFVYTEVEISRL